MRTELVQGLAIFAIAAGIFLSCTDNDGPIRPTDETAQPLFIEDQIILDSTVSIHPDEFIEGRLIFDFAKESTVTSSEYNDISVFYCTWGPRDEGNMVYDFDCECWSELVPDLGPYISIGWPDCHTHLLSARGFSLESYLSDDLELWIRPWFEDSPRWQEIYQAKMLRLNKGYKPIPLPNDSLLPYVDLAFDGQSYYLIMTHHVKLRKLTETGELIWKRNYDSFYPKSMTYGGGNLWISVPDLDTWGDSSRIIRLDTLGNISGTFYAPNRWPGGIEWIDGDLWLAEDERSATTYIYCIDSEASCAAGTTVVKNIINIGQHGDALAWDGTHLLMSGDLLYKLTPQGKLVKAYVWSVGGPEGIAYNNGSLHVLCSGPADIRLKDQVIVPLRMR